MIQRLAIALAQIKADKTSENLLNQICKTTYSLYQVTKKSIKQYNEFNDVITQK